MQFVYYIPDGGGVGEFLATRPDVFPGGAACTHKAQAGTSAGPDKKSGRLVTWNDETSTERLQKADALKWDDFGAYWIGYNPDNLPSPIDLARADMVSYYSPIPLGDGNQWQIPTGRTWPTGSPLPKVRKVRPDGTVERRVKRQFARLSEATDMVWEGFETGNGLSMEDENWIAETALVTNYRVGLPEISILELLDDDSLKLLFMILADRANWQEGDE